MTPTNDAPVTVEEAATDAAFRAINGPDADPFANPESWDFAATVADAVRHRLAALASAPAGEGDVIEAAARAMCDRVNGIGDYDENIGQRRPGWTAQAKAALDAAALARPRAAVGEQSREAIEAECAALIATYYRREIGTLMQQAEHWAENGKPLAVHHRVMKADDYFQIVCQMERDPAKGWKLPFDEIRDALGRKPIKGPGTYPPSKDLYRYRDPAFVVAALQSPPAKVKG